MSQCIWSWLCVLLVLPFTGCSDSGGGEGGGFDGVPLAFQAYLKASAPDTSDHFGRNVALDGDTLVIGVPDEDSAGIGVNSGLETSNAESGSGAVYVFVRNNGVWSQQAYIKASNTGGGDAFGASVAISGDTVVVGAPGEDGHLLTGSTSSPPDNTTTGDGASASGAAYVFTRSGTTWSQQAYIKASNAGANDNFGTSVAINVDTLTVGAPDEDGGGVGITTGSPNDTTTGNAASGSGAVYLFTRSGTTWSQHAYLKASNTETGDAFGTGISISGTKLGVGAPGEDSNLTTVLSGSPSNLTTGDGAAGAGAVYTFVSQGGGWSQHAYVKAPNAETGDAFGTSVSIDGDTVAASATGEKSSATGVGGNQADNSLSNAGAVYVFR